MASINTLNVNNVDYQIEDSFPRTESRVLVTDATTGLITPSDITTTELGYLDGLTTNIATALAAKAEITEIFNSTTVPEGAIPCTFANYDAILLSCVSNFNTDINKTVYTTKLIPCGDGTNITFDLTEPFMYRSGSWNNSYFGALFSRSVTFNSDGITFNNDCKHYCYKDQLGSTAYQIIANSTSGIFIPRLILGIKF